MRMVWKFELFLVIILPPECGYLVSELSEICKYFVHSAKMLEFFSKFWKIFQQFEKNPEP